METAIRRDPHIGLRGLDRPTSVCSKSDPPDAKINGFMPFTHDQANQTGATRLLQYAKTLQAIAQAGLAYPSSPYDVERYDAIRALSVKLLQELTDESYEKIVRVFASETGYQTPKVDIRAVLFRNTNEILLVKETIDHGRWTVPGGWADVGYTPFEVAAKEAQEETGLIVHPVRLLALFDKRKHPHPPQPWYVYKLFIHCEVTGGELQQETAETAGARWFRQEELAAIELSTDRVTLSQIEALFPFAQNPHLPALCD
jgi:ADP-ribose pyrophosphatase YjhB (NUDIX family)